MSPHTRRRLVRQATNGTPSSGSSRNESPRFMPRDSESQYGVVKLKKSAARNNPNRNSTSFQTSTLQEDLLKLIGHQEYDKVPSPSKSKVLNLLVRFHTCERSDCFCSLVFCLFFPLSAFKTSYYH